MFGLVGIVLPHALEQVLDVGPFDFRRGRSAAAGRGSVGTAAGGARLLVLIGHISKIRSGLGLIQWLNRPRCFERGRTRFILTFFDGEDFLQSFVQLLFTFSPLPDESMVKAIFTRNFIGGLGNESLYGHR